MASPCLWAWPTAYRLHVRPSLWRTALRKLQLPLVALYKCYAFTFYLYIRAYVCMQVRTSYWSRTSDNVVRISLWDNRKFTYFFTTNRPNKQTASRLLWIFLQLTPSTVCRQCSDSALAITDVEPLISSSGHTHTEYRWQPYIVL